VLIIILKFCFITWYFNDQNNNKDKKLKRDRDMTDDVFDDRAADFNFKIILVGNS